jgi:hypothetical protein
LPETVGRSSSARTVFLCLAALGGLLWIAIAAGAHGEKDADSAAWLTCFTFWAPVSYPLVVGRRAWSRPGVLHALLIVSAAVFTVVELGIVAQSPRLPRIPLPKANLPAGIALPIFYGALASWISTPFLSVLVFVLGRRRAR